MDICSDLVSIIVPAYQAEKHLKECVCSLLNQTHRAVEIIVVDDGSTDGTSAIVSRMADSDNRLRLITQKNGGVSFARNHGIAASRGSYLMFVDADDWIEPFAVETLLAAIKNNGTDAVYCSQYYDSNGVLCASETCISRSDSIDASVLLKYQLDFRFIACPWLCLMSRDAAAGCAFPEDVHILEDWFFNVELLNNSRFISVTDTAFYHYRSTEQSVSRSALNEKKFSCMELPNKVVSLLDFQGEKANSLRLRLNVGLIRHLLIVAAASGFADEYCRKKMANWARSTVGEAFASPELPLKLKSYVLLGSISPRLFAFIFHFKRKAFHD